MLPKVSDSFMFWELDAFEKCILCSLPGTLKRHFEEIRKLTKVLVLTLVKLRRETQVFVLY